MLVDLPLRVAGYVKRFSVYAQPSKINLSFVTNISDRLAHAIRHSGQTKGALASHIGVPQSSVSRWLKGMEPRAERLAEIAKFLSVDVNWLLTGEIPGEAGIAESSANMKELAPGPGENLSPQSDPFSLQSQIDSIRLHNAPFTLAELQARMSTASAWPPTIADGQLTPAQLWHKYAP